MSKQSLTLSLILFFFSANFMLAQNKSDSTNFVNDSMQTSIMEDLNFNMLFIGLSYTSNNTNNQNFSDINIPSMIGDLTFYHHSGLWTSFVYTNYLKESSTYETELQLGYQKNIIEGIDLDLYYGWRKFSGNKEYESIDYTHTLSLLSSFESGIFAFNLENYAYFGASSNYFLDAEIGLNIDFEHLITKDDLFNFSPSCAASFGTDHWIYDEMGNRRKTIITNFLHRNNFTTNTFEYQSINFYIPILYTISNYSISFSWVYSIPSQKFKLLNWDDQSAFLISFIYSPNI